MDGRTVKNEECLVVALVGRDLAWIVDEERWDWAVWGRVERDVWTYVCVIS